MMLRLELLVLMTFATVITAKVFCPNICPLQLDPVCGSDGMTYGNACFFSCQQVRDPNLSLKHTGECAETEDHKFKEQPCFCTLDYSPVCGSDGKTYDNICLLRCDMVDDKSLRFVHDGECYKTKPCY